MTAVAVVIAAPGLFGLAAFMAEKRIAIGKAVGAGVPDIIRLLLWYFTRPVLSANLIAWPIAGYAMNRWLHSFVYHLNLEPGIFVGAGCAALAIAGATVLGHAIRLARSAPIASLRYE